jgi:hypothetical protein
MQLVMPNCGPDGLGMGEFCTQAHLCSECNGVWYASKERVRSAIDVL